MLVQQFRAGCGIPKGDNASGVAHRESGAIVTEVKGRDFPARVFADSLFFIVFQIKD